MSKDHRDQMALDPEDQTRDFTRGTSATAALDSERKENPSAEPEPQGAWHPTKARAAACRQCRTTQEGAAEQTVPNTGPA